MTSIPINNVVKEMGLLKKTVVVCENVGDFDDYIIDSVNGFLIPISNPTANIKELISKVYYQPEIISLTGENLNKTVHDKFNLGQTDLNKYLDILSITQ